MPRHPKAHHHSGISYCHRELPRQRGRGVSLVASTSLTATSPLLHLIVSPGLSREEPFKAEFATKSHKIPPSTASTEMLWTANPSIDGRTKYPRCCCVEPIRHGRCLETSLDALPGRQEAEIAGAESAILTDVARGSSSGARPSFAPPSSASTLRNGVDV
ncbi:hypothetical protein B0T11DRAFT_283824 [Plectosphaerella cucumerina]|uniref:Uncharacterized protein n=1 Tax=Plectosphaerella cucumerina TaxID=40658 RepID=A0A8K0TDI1_9PEZI|nr:hypothetical protein B0T11DRAFT_283824 [Plectosphaerella cucumerina]